MAKRKSTPVEDYITSSEAAQILGVTRVYVNQLLARGVLRGRKMTDRLWMVERSSLPNWTRQRKHKPKELSN
jgi:excisionase family DNA binding protein